MAPRLLAAPLLAGVSFFGCAPADEPIADGDDRRAAEAFWTDVGEAPHALPASLLGVDAPPAALWSSPDPARSPADGTRGLGYHALGNGSVFTVLGVGVPANTLHGMVGPDYDKAEDAYWPDMGLVLTRGGEVIPAVHEEVYRLAGTAVVATRLEAAGVALWTLDAAPWLDDWPTAPDADVSARHARLVRRVLVEDLGDGIPDDLEVRTVTGTAFDTEDGWLVRRRGDRVLWWGEPTRGVGAAQDGVWRAAASQLTTPATLHVVATWSDQTPDDVPDLPDDAVERTVEAWRAWSATGLQLQGPSRLTGLVDANRVALRTQLSARGATCPMVFYTLSWNRDIIGPVRAFLQLGLFAEAEAILDYHWTAVRRAGGLANAYSGAIDPRTVVETPDFEAQTGVSGGRTAAEGPSYTPLAYDALWRATGQADRVEERLGLMLRALRGQSIDDGLMPFSGDETFRPLMASSFGLPLTFAFEEDAWSSNSALLWVAAAERVAAMAAAVGRDDVVDALLDDADALRVATEQAYARPGGGLLPFLYRDGAPAPTSSYPDVSMKAAWSGYADPLSSDHADLVDATMDELWDEEEGLAYLPAAPGGEVADLDIRKGIVTGMSAGYTTWTLARTFRPEVGPAARFLADSSDPGGTWPEVLVVDDRTGLTPFYTAGGFTETWARYRPWEGGIDVEALLTAALGLDADARTSTLRLAPALPELGELHATSVPVGTHAADVLFQPGMERHTLVVTPDGDLSLRLELCALAGAEPELMRDGEAVAVQTLLERGDRTVYGVTLPPWTGQTELSWRAGCP